MFFSFPIFKHIKITLQLFFLSLSVSEMPQPLDATLVMDKTDY